MHRNGLIKSNIHPKRQLGTKNSGKGELVRLSIILAMFVFYLSIIEREYLYFYLSKMLYFSC